MTSSPIQRNASGLSLTSAGSMTSCSTGSSFGQRSRRRFLAEALATGFEASTLGVASAFSAEAAAFPKSRSFKSNSSWAASSFSLLDPKRRRMSKSIFSFSSLISCSVAHSRPGVAGSEPLMSSWSVTSFGTVSYSAKSALINRAFYPNG